MARMSSRNHGANLSLVPRSDKGEFPQGRRVSILGNRPSRQGHRSAMSPPAQQRAERATSRAFTFRRLKLRSATGTAQRAIPTAILAGTMRSEFNAKAQRCKDAKLGSEMPNRSGHHLHSPKGASGKGHRGGEQTPIDGWRLCRRDTAAVRCCAAPPRDVFALIAYCMVPV